MGRWAALVRVSAVFVGVCASMSASASTWEEWSDTDISRFWSLPEIASARTHVSATPSADAQFAWSIALPPARYAPSLGVVYSARGGDDPHFGTGFRLDVPEITEDPTRPETASERFVGPDGPLVGSVAFRALEDHSGTLRQYRRVDADTWKVTSKTGELWTFRRTAPGRFGLTRQEDAFGGVITYTWSPEARLTDIRYGGPTGITVGFVYGDERLCGRSSFRFGASELHDRRLTEVRVEAGTAATRLRTVAFTYADECPDRLVQIDDTGLSDSGGPAVTRSVAFTYTAVEWTQQPSDFPGDALGFSNTEYGFGGLELGSAETLGVGSNDGDPLPDPIFNVGRQRVDFRFAEQFEHRLDTERAVDFDSDGYTDFLAVNGTNVDITWGRPGAGTSQAAIPVSAPGLGNAIQIPDSLAPVAEAVQTIDLMDWDGDGYLDFVEGVNIDAVNDHLQVHLWSPFEAVWDMGGFAVDAPWCVSPATLSGFRVKLAHVCPLRVTSTRVVADNVFGGLERARRGEQSAGLVDLNGDGLTDFVEVTDVWMVRLRTGPSTWAPPGEWAGGPAAMMSHHEAWMQPVDGVWVDYQSRSTIGMADVNGDGLVDVLNSFARVWFENTGVGFRARSLAAEVVAFAESTTNVELVSVQNCDGDVDTDVDADADADADVDTDIDTDTDTDLGCGAPVCRPMHRCDTLTFGNDESLIIGFYFDPVLAGCDSDGTARPEDADCALDAYAPYFDVPGSACTVDLGPETIGDALGLFTCLPFAEARAMCTEHGLEVCGCVNAIACGASVPGCDEDLSRVDHCQVTCGLGWPDENHPADDADACTCDCLGLSRHVSYCDPFAPEICACAPASGQDCLDSYASACEPALATTQALRCIPNNVVLARHTTVQVGPGDFDGNGTTDLLDSTTGLIATTGQPEYLLASVRYGVQGGAQVGTTTLAWRGTGDLSYDDTNGEHHLHQAFPTLYAVTETDDVVHTDWTITHAFTDGFWDPVRRKFTGFAKQTTTDSDDRRSSWTRSVVAPFAGMVTYEEHGSIDVPDEVVITRANAPIEEFVMPDGSIATFAMPEQVKVVERGPELVPGVAGAVAPVREARFHYDADGNADQTLVLGDPVDASDNLTVTVDWESRAILHGTTVAERFLPEAITVSDGTGELSHRSMTYNARGALTSVSAERTGLGLPPGIRTWTLNPNAVGLPELVVSPLGAETTMTYDPSFRYVAETVDALGHVSLTTQDRWGNTTESIAPTGVSTLTAYDGAGRVKTVARVSVDNAVWNTVSDAVYTDGAHPSAKRTTFGNGDGLTADAVSIAYADAWGGTVQTRSWIGGNAYLVGDVEFGNDGKVRRTGRAYTGLLQNYTGFDASDVAITEYDKVGRWLASMNFAAKITAESSDDPWLSIVVGDEGRQAITQKDAFGRVEARSAADATGDLEGADYVYDGLGRLTSVTDPDGITTDYTWSSLGELLLVESPDFGWRAYDYDEDGNLVHQEDAAGRTVTWERDLLGRPVHVFYDEDLDTPVETYTYDDPAGGLLVEVTDAAGEVTYGYDGFARQDTTHRWFADDGSQAERTVVYDALDRVVEEHNPDGVIVRWDYAHGRLERVRATLDDGGRNRPATTTTLATLSYDEHGDYTGFTSEWGLSLDVDRDVLGRAEQIAWDLPIAIGSDLEVDYTYTSDGLVESRSINGASTTYHYDAAGRLVEATGEQAGTWDLTDGGTPLGITGTGGAVFTMHPGTHQAKTVTDSAGVWNYDYDAAGRVTSTYQLNAHGVHKKVVDYTYDALGRPLMADGRVTRFMGHDGSVPVEYEDGKWIHRLGSWEKVQNETRTQVGAEGLPVARIHNGKKLFAVMSDAQGTPLRVYKAENGALQDDLDVDVYGHEVTASAGGKNVAHHWLGLSRSRKLGLTSTAARLYEARSSLFLSPDPMMLHTGAIGLATDPYMSNTYAYGRWSGAVVSDPDGQCGFSVAACAVAQKLSGAETTQQAIADPWFWGGYAAVPVTGTAAWLGAPVAAPALGASSLFSAEMSAPIVNAAGAGSATISAVGSFIYNAVTPDYSGGGVIGAPLGRASWSGLPMTAKAGELAQRLWKPGQMVQLAKGEVTLKDIGSLASATGKEFAVVRIGTGRYLVRGTANNVLLPATTDKLILHTHSGVGNYIPGPSKADIDAITRLRQGASALINESGAWTWFDQGSTAQ